MKENFATVLETVADVRADFTAVTHGDRSRTWRQLDDRASRLAAFLAARGHGNRAIAERLYVTQRTVETHLTHAFQKLDISSRAELAAVLEPEVASPALAR